MYRRIIGAVLCLFIVFGTAGAIGYSLKASQTPAKAPCDEQHDPIKTIDAFFTALSEQNYEKSNSFLLDCNSLGFEKVPKDAIERFLWEKMRESYSHKIVSEPKIIADTAYVKVQITGLSLKKATPYVKSRTVVVLETAMKNPEESGEMFDENGEYLESFIMNQYEKAAKDILENAEKYYSSTEITITLQYINGEWMIVVTDEFAEVLTGNRF